MVLVEKQPIFVKAVKNGSSWYFNLSKEIQEWLGDGKEVDPENLIFVVVPEVRKKDGHKYVGIGIKDSE
jgi:hypothetical protein